MTSKRRAVLFVTFVITVALGSSLAFAQAPPATAAPAPTAALKPAALGLAVYPGKGQDATQQGKDEGECYGWARQQTGIDPTVARDSRPRGGRPEGRGGQGRGPRGREGRRRRCGRRRRPSA